MQDIWFIIIQALLITMVYYFDDVEINQTGKL